MTKNHHIPPLLSLPLFPHRRSQRRCGCAFPESRYAYDADTQLQNNINRWYDAAVGRWLSTDPIGFEGGDANLYRYVGNSAGRYLDVDGLKFRPVGGVLFQKPMNSNWIVIRQEIDFSDQLGIRLPFQDQRCSKMAYEFTNFNRVSIHVTTVPRLNNIFQENWKNIHLLENIVSKMPILASLSYTFSELCVQPKCCTNEKVLQGNKVGISYKVRLFVQRNVFPRGLTYQITIKYTADMKYEGTYGDCK